MGDQCSIIVDDNGEVTIPRCYHTPTEAIDWFGVFVECVHETYMGMAEGCYRIPKLPPCP